MSHDGKLDCADEQRLLTQYIENNYLKHCQELKAAEENAREAGRGKNARNRAKSMPRLNSR